MDWLGAELVDALRAAHGGGMDGVVIGDAMRLANPKYIPREWMLAYAYEAAEKGDYEPVKELHQVLTRPYDEQPMFEERFYKRAAWGGAAGRDWFYELIELESLSSHEERAEMISVFLRRPDVTRRSEEGV